LHIHTFPVGDIGANCYLVVSEDKQGLLIDPGAEPDKLITAIQDLGIGIKYIVLTHGHLDHIGAVEELRKQTGSKVLIHELDNPCLTDAKLNLSYFFGSPILCGEADTLIKDGEQITLGNETFTVLHTPGHTAGGICLVGGEVVFTGDSLFAGSVGRTDFPGGSADTLIESIKGKILTLGPNTKVYPGHGPSTTVEEEKRSNPYL
jgi:hydroxyacylglutathione hydrolase